MGDRANVKITSDEGDVFLYTHWQGTELPAIVQKALARQQRWSDASYLTRIIFCTMLGEDTASLTGETGFGISHTVGDGSDRVVTVNVEAQTVSWKDKSLSFEEFINLKKVSW